jgi:flagellar basal-body rod protein FlgB
MIKALDGLTARSVVTAQNIANAGTPGYRPMRVSFEQALASAASAGAGAVRAVMPHIEVDPTAAGDSELRTDLELATASTTTARYAALVEVLNRRLQIDALALSGAR